FYLYQLRNPFLGARSPRINTNLRQCQPFQPFGLFWPGAVTVSAPLPLRPFAFHDCTRTGNYSSSRRP
ncbi:hypothetical protein, partial [Klebsiella pneumoniae]